MKYFLATLIILITLPLVAQAEVRINEIAWMGTTNTNGQYGEWFELYNIGSESVSLSGWKLYKTGGTKLVYTFSGTIPAGGYYVIERTTASVPDPLPAVNNESGVFSNSGFANTGEFLILKDGLGNIIQSIDQQSGWLAGDAAAKNTMQYSSGGWITALPTPGAVNSAVVSTTSEEEEIDVEKEQELYTTEKGSNTSVRTKESQEKVLPLLVRARKDPHIDFTFPSVVYTGATYDFTGAITLEYSMPTDGVFVWNMGDGTVIRTTTNAPIQHSYRYSGTYTVTLSYYPTDRYGKPVLWANRKTVVVDPQLTLRTLDSDTIEIKNQADTTVDLSYWVISTPFGSGAIPEMTILAPNTRIALSTQAFNIGTVTQATLSTMNGTVVASTNTQQSPVGRNIVKSAARVLSTKKIQEPVLLEPIETASVYTPEPVLVKQNHTKNIIIGVIVVAVMIVLLFLERFIAYRE